MFGLKEVVFFSLLLFCVVESGKRNSQCDQVCQRKMTIECCECIGCHQGMRFGKRSQPFSTPELEEASIAASKLNQLEQAVVELEIELAARAQQRRLLENYNH